MITVILTDKQEKVVTSICEIEIDSLTELLEDGPDDESRLLIEQHEGSTIDDWYKKVEDMRTQFFTLQKEPSKLFQMDPDYISIFRHILFNLEEADEKPKDCITIKYPKAIKNLWRKLFTSEEFKQLTSITLSN